MVFFSRKIAYTTHHFCMTTVPSQLSIPPLLVRVSATRWRGDLEVPYCQRQKASGKKKKKKKMLKVSIPSC